jgi:hypothetical protein
MTTSIIKEHVNKLFSDAAPMSGDLCINPVIGGIWLAGEDPIIVQKNRARRALVAREWFYIHGPKDAPPLPLSGSEQAALRYRDPLGHLVVDFARSLEENGWEINNHPSFEDFARGVLASAHSPDFTRKNEALLKRYPPRPLSGIRRGQVWRPATRCRSCCRPNHSRPSAIHREDHELLG